MRQRSTKRFVLPMPRFFWWSVTVKSWIPSAIHCIQPFHYCRNTKGYRTEANPRGTRVELELSFIVNTAITFQSCDLQICHKQAGFHISPSHHIGHAELQIQVRLSSESLAFTILDWSLKINALLIGCPLKRKDNFQWIKIVISLLVVLLFN